MTRPKVSLRIQGTKLSPSQGLSNSIDIFMDTKSDEILENPTTGSQTLTGRSNQISPCVLASINLRSADHNHIQQLLRSQLNISPSLYEILATRISTAATELGFGFNGFVMNVFATVTYYHRTVAFVMSDPPSSDSNDDSEEISLNAAIFRMVQKGKINREELESLKIETETCSICLEDLSNYNSKHGGPTRMTCSHVFHNRCLMEWLDTKNTCPLCRSVLYDR